MSDHAPSAPAPRFAVIGHPNKGKSSIVATLAEDDTIAVSPVPGTTRAARRFALRVDGELLYELVDTPGFQRARALLAWLKAQETDASERPALVAAFIEAHGDDDRFHDERELLTPLIEGAGILYVVDGAKPYGPEYELEMEVLRWTGQPRMALINLIGAGDYVEEWRAALGQYFSIVRVFDAMHADFDKRLDLLRGFAELDERFKPALRRAVEVLVEERRSRVRQSAADLADLLCDVLTFSESAPLPPSTEGGEAETGTLRESLTDRLKSRIRRREDQARNTIAQRYRHFQLETQDSTARLLDTELFARESWQLFGLSRQQLLVTGALSGAVAGGGVDLLLGGASLFLGAGLGAVLGSAGAWLGSEELARVKVLGARLGGRRLQVGPVQDANFPYVVLGRAWRHHQLISERNHARREALAVDLGQARHQMDQIPADLRRGLARQFGKLGSEGATAARREALAEIIEQILALADLTEPDLTEVNDEHR
ncbi:MAG: GTPase/DUF3482 domain-containing protein [Pseudomonadota bacterium]